MTPITSSPAAPHPAGRLSILLSADALIGRQTDLHRLRQALLVEQRRLVTVLGPGGIGKTRLALQTAADLASHFADGAAFVSLATTSDTANVTTLIAEAVGCVLPAQGAEAALLAFLRERVLLLILDNLEHLLGPRHADHLTTLLT